MVTEKDLQYLNLQLWQSYFIIVINYKFLFAQPCLSKVDFSALHTHLQQLILPDALSSGPNSFKLESFSMEAIASVAHTVTGNRQPTLVHTLREIRWNIERGVENVLSNLITAKHDNSVSKWHQQLASMVFWLK